MKCKKCGTELEKNSVTCPSCGNKTKSSLIKKWWFWAIIVVIILIISISSGGNENTSNTDTTVTTTSASVSVSQTETTTKAEETIEYEKFEVQQMIDDLKANALKAEKTYNKKNVEITGKITNFDSSGDYISIEAINAGDFNFDTIQCYVKNDAQLDFLLEKTVGDTITIKGKITSVGEILGYSINIDEVQ